jgi:hypothetical protein
LLLRCAYGWLAAGAGGPGGWTPPADLERQALGAGCLTLPILGMATLLLPGFVGGRAPDAPVGAALLVARGAGRGRARG